MNRLFKLKCIQAKKTLKVLVTFYLVVSALCIGQPPPLTHGPNLWTRLIYLTPGQTCEALKTRSCCGFNLWIIHVWEEFNQLIHPTRPDWTRGLSPHAALNTRSCLGLDSWIVHAWEVCHSIQGFWQPQV